MLNDLLQPRFMIGFSALVIVGILMFAGVVEPDMGMALIVGVLVSFGAYYMRSPRSKE